MKRLILSIAVAFLSIAASAQKRGQDTMMSPSPVTNTVIPGGGLPESAASRDKTLVNDTPENIVVKFGHDHPGNGNATWIQEGKNYKAIYTDDQTKMPHAVIYDAEGNVIRTETQLDDMYSPSGVTEYYSKYHPNEKYKVWQSDESGKRSYYTQHNGQTEWFDENGNYVPGNKKSPMQPTEPKSYNTKSSDKNTKSGNTKNAGKTKGQTSSDIGDDQKQKDDQNRK